jgi:HPt (histidine-containing phosphotransfer) domain-containing protein
MTRQIGETPRGVDHLEEATLDRSVIAEFGRDANGVPEFVVALIGQYIAEAGAQVERMREAGQRVDAPALKAIAHALRGSSMMLGARRLGSLCEQIERGAGQEAGFAGAAALLPDLDREFVKVRDALGAELQRAEKR